MTCVFVQIRCNPGKTYAVADTIYEREIASELYSTSGAGSITTFEVNMTAHSPLPN